MAHILIGWEFGSNRGHAVRAIQLAHAMRAEGHRISFALQRIDALGTDDVPGADIWPAPVSPRLLITTARPRRTAPNSMGDILAHIGCDDAALVRAVLRGWDHLLGAIRPDLVIADAAPFLLMAAAGRIPSIAVGNGFTVPPSSMAFFPSLTGRAAAIDEMATLDAVNSGLASAGRSAIEALPRAFAATRAIAATLAELDCYGAWRQAALAPPMTTAPTQIATGAGTEVFVYVPETLPADAALWQGLALAKLPIRVHVPRADSAYHRTLASRGFAVEPEPLPFGEIARRSRTVISHGGHGFICSALLAGLPQVVCHSGLERHLLGNAVAALKLGGQLPLAKIEPEGFAASLNQLYNDDALAARVRAAAPGFHGRGADPFTQIVAAAVSELV